MLIAERFAVVIYALLRVESVGLTRPDLAVLSFNPSATAVHDDVVF